MINFSTLRAKFPILKVPKRFMSGIELLLVKFLVTTCIVLLLSFVAEHVSPKWAGILSGFPTGSAITLHFYAVENGLEFAGESALYNMVGLVAMQTFILCYYLSGLSATRYRLLLSVCGGGVGYVVAAVILSRVPVTPVLAILLPLVSFPLFRMAFCRIAHAAIDEKITPTLAVIMGRAGLAACTICLVTAIAQLVGSSWAGLFSAFPTTLFPLLLIVHFSYGGRYAYSIIKHVPDGLGSLLTYSFLIYLCYPSFGIYSGMGIAFSGALVYLFLYQLASNHIRQRTMQDPTSTD